MAPVAERVSGSQQIQLLYCPAVVYWAGSYLWDMATHLLVCIAALAIFAAFGDEVIPYLDPPLLPRGIHTYDVPDMPGQCPLTPILC